MYISCQGVLLVHTHMIKILVIYRRNYKKYEASPVNQGVNSYGKRYSYLILEDKMNAKKEIEKGVFQ